MKRKNPIWAAAAALLLIAGVASAQNADQNTGGPTKNTLRLRLVEPREGAQISGSSIRVTVDYNRTLFGEGKGSSFGNANYPQPRFDIYVDNSLKQTLKGGETNVADIQNVAPGKHKVAVVAKNVSNEIIDRAEVSVTNMEAAMTSSDTSASKPPVSDSTASTYSSPAATTAPEPAPPKAEPAPVASAAPAPAPAHRRLPRTASPAPAAAALGLALVAAGLWVSRRGF
jgi:hypothetical protein